MGSRLGLRSALLADAGFRHAFFMRQGGVSAPPWESLNFSTGTGDSPEAVAENVRRAAGELEVEVSQLYYLSQVHGTADRVLHGGEAREAVMREEGDITLSAAPGVACGVRIADCAPILLADTRSGAVAAIHSGWRGTVQGAVAAGVAALQRLVQAPRGHPAPRAPQGHPAPRAPRAPELIAAVGPHIERCCFEVGPDVAEQIAAASRARDVVHLEVTEGARPHVDLRAVIDAQLREAGVAEIDHVRGCTVCDAARFHSYRRDGARSGRMLAAVVAGA